MLESRNATPEGADAAAPKDPVDDPTSDARLDRLLHDLDVANDAHPCRWPPRQADTPDR
jgi:hypothetical protein